MVLVSPYSWLEEYTPVSEWFGAVSTETGPVDSFEHLQAFIEQQGQMKLVYREDIPFLIREHERKYQYGVSDCTVWEKV